METADLGVLSLSTRSDREDIVGELLDLGQKPPRRPHDVQCLHFMYNKAMNFGECLSTLPWSSWTARAFCWPGEAE